MSQMTPVSASAWQRVGQAGRLGIRRRRGGDRDTGDLERPAGPARLHRGLPVAHLDVEPPQGHAIPGGDAERLGEGGLEHHAAVTHPAALRRLGLVDRGRGGVAALRLCHHGAAVRLELRRDRRIRTAVGHDAGLVRQGLHVGGVGAGLRTR